jgi:acetoacetate decarboxylase
MDETWRGATPHDKKLNAEDASKAVVEPLEGFFWRANLTLVPGRVLYDYLKGRQ